MESARQLFQVFTSKELFIEWLLAINISIGKKLLRKKAEIEVETYSVTNKDIDMRTAPQAIKNNMIYDANVLQERWDICNSCEFLKDDKCLKCGCYMRAAIKLKGKACPVGKWGKYIEGEPNGIVSTI